MFLPKERLTEFVHRKHEHGGHGVREHSVGFVMSLMGKGLGRGSAHHH